MHFVCYWGCYIMFHGLLWSLGLGVVCGFGWRQVIVKPSHCWNIIAECITKLYFEILHGYYCKHKKFRWCITRNTTPALCALKRICAIKDKCYLVLLLPFFLCRSWVIRVFFWVEDAFWDIVLKCVSHLHESHSHDFFGHQAYPVPLRLWSKMT